MNNCILNAANDTDRVKQLSVLVDLAKYNRTICGFAKDCKLIDPKPIEDILNCKIKKFPHPSLLMKIAIASEGRTTYKQLMLVCGYEEEDDILFQLVKNTIVKRSEIYYAELSGTVGSEQGGVRPVLIVSNDIGNEKGTIIQVSPITTRTGKNKMVTHVQIGCESGLNQISEIMIEQTRCIDKRRLFYSGVGVLNKVGEVPEYIMEKVDTAILKEYGLIDVYFNEEYAYKLINVLKDAKETKKIIVNNFKKYCAYYDKDYNEVYSRYKMLLNGEIQQPKMAYAYV